MTRRPPLLAELGPLDPFVPTYVVVRALAHEGDRSFVADPSGSRWVLGKLPLHGLCRVGLVRADGMARAAVVEELTAPRDSLHRDGDVLRILGGVGSRLLARARALAAARAFLGGLGSIEVETPALVRNPGMDVHLDAFDVPTAERHLTTSPEYALKRMLASGFPRVHQIGRSFRRGERGPLHAPEFTMIEWYGASLGCDDMCRETEALVCDLVRAASGGTTLRRGEVEVDLSPPWPRIPYAEAVARAGVAVADPASDEAFRRYALEVQPRLGHGRPVWVVDWPIALASLARPQPLAPALAERFEAYVAGVEICNGFVELTDPAEQRRRFERDARERQERGHTALPVDENLLRALEDGMPPAAGNALGFDRVVMLATGAIDLDGVTAIPYERS